MVEGARLESVFRGNSNGGSNPLLSAILKHPMMGVFLWIEGVRSEVGGLFMNEVNGRRQAIPQGTRAMPEAILSYPPF